jgi:Na+-translocating ferredoxin:NAD+ oxidoreductase RnfD subunit
LIANRPGKSQELDGLRPCGLILFYLRAQASLAALRPYVYMCELPGLATENWVFTNPRAAPHFILAISIWTCLAYICQADRNWTDAHTHLPMFSSALFFLIITYACNEIPRGHPQEISCHH